MLMRERNLEGGQKICPVQVHTLEKERKKKMERVRTVVVITLKVVRTRVKFCHLQKGKRKKKKEKKKLLKRGTFCKENLKYLKSNLQIQKNPNKQMRT